jgi:hypothetical protein
MNDLVVVQKIAGWEKLKALVLDSVSSPITKRVYNMALDEFLPGGGRRQLNDACQTKRHPGQACSGTLLTRSDCDNPRAVSVM